MAFRSAKEFRRKGRAETPDRERGSPPTPSFSPSTRSTRECSVLTQLRLAHHFADRDRLFVLDFRQFQPPEDFETVDPDLMFFGCWQAFGGGYEFNDLQSIQKCVRETQKYRVAFADRGYIILTRRDAGEADDRENRGLADRWLGESLQRYPRLYGVQIKRFETMKWARPVNGPPRRGK